MRTLKKGIGKFVLFLFMINGIIGTGIFFLPAIGAGISGPASIFAWIVMSIVSIIISFYFAELVSMFPKSGGIYEYTKKSFGKFPSFVIGWIAWLVANITISMLIVGSLIYIMPGAGYFVHVLLASVFIIIFNYVSYRGISLSGKLLAFFGLATIFALIILIIPGMFRIDIEKYHPLILEPFTMLLTIYIISETFFGWEIACYLAEEVKDARRTVPKMLVLSTVVIVAISLLLVIVSLGIVNWDIFSKQAAPLVFVASTIFGNQFASVFSVLVFIPLIGTVASWIISSPRLLFAMARDKVLPSSLGKMHHTNRTPHAAIAFQTIITIIITAISFANFHFLLSLLIPLAIIMYSAVILSFIKLRVKIPNKKRYFRAPFGIYGAWLVVLFNVLLLAVWLTTGSSIYIFLMGVFLVLFGVPLYFLIKIQTDKRFVEKFYDRISFLWDRIFPYLYSKSDVKMVVSRLKLSRKSKVLDFGCGTGITTAALAKAAGMVVAVDISEKQLERAYRKLKEKENVIFVREHELKFNRNSFDAITAVGSLEHTRSPRQAMKKLFSFLKNGGRFSFLCFGKSLEIPSEEFTSAAEIRKLFSGLGVEMNIKREFKKGTEYWYIWGCKK